MIITLLIILSLLFSACSIVDSNTIIPELTISLVGGGELDNHAVNFTQEGDKMTVNIASNTTWRVKSNADWLQLSKLSGRGDDYITITADAAEKSRSAAVEIYLTDFNQIRASFDIIQYVEPQEEQPNDNKGDEGDEGEDGKGEDDKEDNPDDNSNESKDDGDDTDDENEQNPNDGDDKDDVENNEGGEDTEKDEDKDNTEDEGDENNDNTEQKPEEDNGDVEDNKENNNEENNEENSDNPDSSDNPDDNKDNNENEDNKEDGGNNENNDNGNNESENNGNEENGNEGNGNTPEQTKDAYSMINTLSQLSAGEYYIGGYQDGTLHLATGGITGGHGNTTEYTFTDAGDLTPSAETEAIVVTLEKAASNGYYIRFEEGYLTATAAGPGKLKFSETKSEYWIFSTHPEGGFMLRQSGDIDVQLIISPKAKNGSLLRSVAGDEEGNAIILFRKNI